MSIGIQSRPWWLVTEASGAPRRPPAARPLATRALAACALAALTPDAMSAHTRASLFETARGRVRRCPCCDRLELRFGNALLALAVDELPTVLAQLGAAEREPAAGGPATDVGRHEVTLFLGDSGCGWVFTADETAELHRLVAGARLMLDLGGPTPGTAAA